MVVDTRQNARQGFVDNILQTFSRNRTGAVNNEQRQNTEQVDAGVVVDEAQQGAGQAQSQQRDATRRINRQEIPRNNQEGLENNTEGEEESRNPFEGVELPREVLQLQENEQQFYRWIGLAARECAHLNLDVFDPEKLLVVMQMNGLNISNGLSVVDTDQTIEGVPALFSRTDIASFTANLRESLEPIIKYCQYVVSGQTSTARFKMLVDSDLPISVASLCATSVTPFIKPTVPDQAFGQFDVRQCDNTLLNMQRFNVGKYHEYCQLYQAASYMFDVGVQQLRILQNASISSSVGKALALSAQCTFQRVQILATRLNEIKLLTSSDMYVREFARQTLVNSETPLGLNKEHQNVVSWAAEARVRRARDAIRESSSWKRGRTQQRGRGGGRNLSWHRNNGQSSGFQGGQQSNNHNSGGRGQSSQQNNLQSTR